MIVNIESGKCGKSTFWILFTVTSLTGIYRFLWDSVSRMLDWLFMTKLAIGIKSFFLTQLISILHQWKQYTRKADTKLKQKEQLKKQLEETRDKIINKDVSKYYDLKSIEK